MGRLGDVAQVLIAVAVVAVVGVVAMVLRSRRSPAAPTQPRRQVPSQLDRRDFDQPDAPWLLVVFSSATCETCAKVVSAARMLAAADVAVQEVEYGAGKALHQRYHVDAVPMLLLADAQGVVRHHALGPVIYSDLQQTLEAVRKT